MPFPVISLANLPILDTVFGDPGRLFMRLVNVTTVGNEHDLGSGTFGISSTYTQSDLLRDLVQLQSMNVLTIKPNSRIQIAWKSAGEASTYPNLAAYIAAADKSNDGFNSRVYHAVLLRKTANQADQQINLAEIASDLDTTTDKVIKAVVALNDKSAAFDLNMADDQVVIVRTVAVA